MVDHRLYWSVSDLSKLVRPVCWLCFVLLSSSFFPFLLSECNASANSMVQYSVVQYSMVQCSVVQHQVCSFWHLVSEMLACVPLVLAHTFFVCRWTQLTSFLSVLLIWLLFFPLSFCFLCNCQFTVFFCTFVIFLNVDDFVVLFCTFGTFFLSFSFLLLQLLLFARHALFFSIADLQLKR